MTHFACPRVPEVFLPPEVTSCLFEKEDHSACRSLRCIHMPFSTCLCRSLPMLTARFNATSLCHFIGASNGSFLSCTSRIISRINRNYRFSCFISIVLSFFVFIIGSSRSPALPSICSLVAPGESDLLGLSRP